MSGLEMKNLRNWSVFAVIGLLVPALVGCGGSGGGSAALVSTGDEGPAVPAVPVVEAQPEATGLGGLPRDAWVDPAEILARRGSELTVRTKPGDEFYCKTANVEASLGMLSFTPDGEDDGAWAVYQFPDLLDADYPLKLSLDFYDELVVPGTCYLGFADYQLNAWDWTCIAEPGLEVSAYLPVTGSAISPGGNLYVVVLVRDCSIAVVESISLELESADPPPPEGLSVSRGLVDCVELGWDDPAETWPGLEYTSVVAERAPDRTGPWERIAEIPAGTTTCSGGTGLAAGVEWFYRLRTVAGERTGWAGNMGRGWAAVGQVPYVIASDHCLNQINLTWAPVEYAEGYRVEFYGSSLTDPKIWATLADLEGGDTTSLVHSDIEPATWRAISGSTYYYRVRAVLEGSLGPASPVDSGVYYSAQVKHLAATGNPEAVVLTWALIFPAEGYLIEYRATEETPEDWTALATVEGSHCTFEHGTMDPPELSSEYGVNYAYRVKAYRGEEVSRDWSDEVIDRRRVGVVDDVLTGANAEMITVYWDAIPGVEGYILEYRDDRGSTGPEDWTVLAEGPAGGFDDLNPTRKRFDHCWDTPLGRVAVPGVYYAYRLKAWYGVDYSPEWSDEVTRCRENVGNYSYLNASESRVDAVSFTASYCSHATGLRLEYRNLDGGEPVDWTPLQTTLDDHTATSPAGCECAADTTYEYRIKGTAGDVEGAEWTVDTGRRGILDVAEFSATDGWYAGTTVLEWSVVTGADGYLIEYRDQAGATPADWTELIELRAWPQETYSHTTSVPAGREAVPFTKYDYRIRTMLGAALSDGVVDRGYCGTGNGSWNMYGGSPRRDWCTPMTGPAVPVVEWHSKLIKTPVVIDAGGDLIGGKWRTTVALTSAGITKWTLINGEEPAYPAQLEDGAIVALGCLFIINPDGTYRWMNDYDGIRFEPVTLDDDGGIYLHTDDYLIALRSDFSVKWSYPFDGDKYNLPSAIGPDGTVYFGDDDGVLYAVAADGGLLWANQFGDLISDYPSVAPDGTVYVSSVDLAADGCDVWAVNPDGTVKWSYPVADVIYASMAVDPAGRCHYLSHGGVARLDVDGNLDWECPVPDIYYTKDLALDGNGTAYAGTQNNELYAINADGTVRWSVQLSSQSGYASSPVVGDGVVYVLGWSEDGVHGLFKVGETV